MQTLCKTDFPATSDIRVRPKGARAPAESTNSPSQLPVSSYFDEALYQREMQQLFARGPRYVGHALSVPQVRCLQLVRLPSAPRQEVPALLPLPVQRAVLVRQRTAAGRPSH